MGGARARGRAQPGGWQRWLLVWEVVEPCESFVVEELEDEVEFLGGGLN